MGDLRVRRTETFETMTDMHKAVSDAMRTGDLSNNRHRHRCSPRYEFGDTPEQESVKSSAAGTADDDLVDISVRSVGHDSPPRITLSRFGLDSVIIFVGERANFSEDSVSALPRSIGARFRRDDLYEIQRVKDDDLVVGKRLESVSQRVE